MNVFLEILQQIFREPAIFLSLFVSLGSFTITKDLTKTLKSAINTFVGIRILQVGAGLAVTASKPILEMLVERFEISGRVADPWVAAGEGLEILNTAGLGGLIGSVMITAWIVHLVFSRLSKLRVIYLTGHVAFIDTTLVIYYLFMATGWSDIKLFLGSVFLLAIYWWFFPSILSPRLRPLVGQEKITIGHQMVVSSWLAITIAKLTGDVSQDTEDVKFPEWLSFLKDTAVSYALIMGLLYLIVAILAGPEVGQHVSGESNYLMYSLLRGVDTGASITIIILGVKMFIGELMPAFEGISRKFLPGAVAAVDIPVFFDYAPNAALIGFIFTFFGMAVGMALQIFSQSQILTIPSIIPMFFGGSTLGVVSSKYGGLRGTVIAAFILGIIQVWGSAAMATVIGSTISGGGNLDYCTYYPLLFGVLKAIFK